MVSQSEFARRLSNLIEDSDLTQMQICRYLGITRSCIFAWCTGKRYPRLDIAVRLCRLLGVTVDDLFYGEGRW